MANFVMTTEQAAQEITQGQGRAVFMTTKVDVRTCNPKITMGIANTIITMTKALNDAKKNGSTVNVAQEDGSVAEVKVTATFYKAQIKQIREQLLKVGGTDKMTPAKEKAVDAPLVIQRLDLVAAMNDKPKKTTKKTTKRAPKSAAKVTPIFPAA